MLVNGVDPFSGQYNVSLKGCPGLVANWFPAVLGPEQGGSEASERRTEFKASAVRDDLLKVIFAPLMCAPSSQTSMV